MQIMALKPNKFTKEDKQRKILQSEMLGKKKKKVEVIPVLYYLIMHYAMKAYGRSGFRWG
jgi:hypothetical protein